MLNDYESSYEDLLNKSGNPSLNLRRPKSLCIEIYKTINNLNPEFMKKLFKVLKTNRAQKEQYNLNLEIPKSIKFLLVLKVCACKVLGFGTHYLSTLNSKKSF